MAELIVRALAGLGIDARVGEVPREYCPGAYSVNARGTTKLAGIGQRMIRGGAHLGGVIVVSDAELIRRVLVPVYEALDLDWDQSTAGSVADELRRDVELSEVEEALIDQLRSRYEIQEAEIDPETLELAEVRLRDAD
jgi:octanoyl-[GcvH]:protein N-octanoyltransferase